MARISRSKKVVLFLKVGLLLTFITAFVCGILIVIDTKDNKDRSAHKLCIIIPFRDRFEELLEFAPYMKTFLDKQNVDHKFIVVNQMDRYRFNRASLINVGFLESKSQCDYIAMHDVDLLPVNEELLYLFPEEGHPYHLAAPHLHPIYHYSNYAGGILLIRSRDFEKLNGLSNKYWGWGREDDEFFVRMKHAKFTLHRPGNLTTGYQSFKHVHDRKKRPRDYNRFFNQSENTRRLDRVTGISTMKYDIDSAHVVVIDGTPVTVLNVYLQCDVNFTPWCLQFEDHEAYLQKLKAEKKHTSKS